jgi:hypothetical protein
MQCSSAEDKRWDAPIGPSRLPKLRLFLSQPEPLQALSTFIRDINSHIRQLRFRPGDTNSPLGCSTGEHLEVRTRARSPQHIPTLLGLGAMCAAVTLEPRHHRVIIEPLSVASDCSKQYFVGVPPIVPDAHLRLYPNEGTAKFKTPGLEEAGCVKQEAIGRPKVKVSVSGAQSPDREQA